MDEHDKPEAATADAAPEPAAAPEQTELILGRPPTQAEKDPVGTVAATAIAEKWQPFYHRLLRTRDYLLDRETSLREQGVEAVPEDRRQADADSATTINDRDMAFAEAASYNDVLLEVNAALQRMEVGTYGTCELTGKPIPQARLEAIPWTRFTKEAEEQSEQQGQAPVHFDLPEAGTIKGKSASYSLGSDPEAAPAGPETSAG